MNSKDDPFELINRSLNGAATPDELQRLEDQLRADPEFRENYLRYLNIDMALGTLHHGLEEETPEAAQSNVIPFPRWRPLAFAATAGLVFGLFCATLTWALVIPKNTSASAPQPKSSSRPILSESFEDPALPLTNGFPIRAGEWGGDIARISTAPSPVKPVDGDSVLRLESSPNSNLGYLQQVIDVSSLPQAEEGEMRVVEVIASFLADQAGEEERYTLRIASFEETSEKVHQIWESVPWRQMDQISLTFAKTGLSTPPTSTGWQTLSTLVELPANARSIVVSLAAGRLNQEAPKTPHYIDDVRAELSIIPFKKRLSRKKR